MGVQLKISNSLEKLAESLSLDLQNNGSPVFNKEHIVTQTTGMNRWLSIRLAELNGVFANFEYLRPNTFINEIFRIAGMEKSRFYSPENLKWPLFALFNSYEFKNRFKHIAEYYLDDDMKRLQLAVKVSDLFDQYSIYRPQYIQSWNKGEQHPELKGNTRHEQWQAWLWQELKTRYPEESENDRVTQRDKLMEIIRSDRKFIDKLKKLYPKVSVFGLSVITPLHVELFDLLSQHILMNIYMVNPAPEIYWVDTRSEKQMARITRKSGTSAKEQLFEEGNELLTNYGNILKDAFDMLYNIDTLDTIDDTNLHTPDNETLLQKIQGDIYRNTTTDRNELSLQDLQDESVQISCSYTEVRELEALHNYLLNLFEKDQTLLPKDIIVLTPDIDQYTPYISAVFDNVPKNNYIPYSIADRSYSGGDNIVGVIELVLNLSENEFTSEKIIQLLDSAYICKRYGITNTGLIRNVLLDSNIRTGVAGEVENDTYLVSWAYGIKRLIYGYAIMGGREYGTGKDSFYPIDSMEGETAREVLRFIDFVDDLIKSLNERKGKKTITDWKEYLINHIVSPFLFAKEEDDREYKYIIGKLDSLDDAASYFNEKVGFDIFRKSVNDLLFSESRSGDFITGSVTFSTMIPMRSLPFKIVAVLGLDNKKFPRTQVDPAFNLIAVKRHPGDRSIKDNDKHLFLETLLAAGDSLFLSYIGSATKDNTEIPPSLLIDELINYVEGSYNGNTDDVKKELLTRHPLHSFSNKYNAKDKKLYSYAEIDIASARKTERDKPEAPVFDKISLDQLINFFKNPFKWYYHKTLKIYYQENEVLLPEFEKFALDNLEQYMVKTSILNADKVDEAVFIDKEKKTGMLPLANIADITFDSLASDVEHIKNILDKLKGDFKEEKETFSIQINGTMLDGLVDYIFNGKHLAYSLSGKKKKGNKKTEAIGARKYMLSAWLQHIALIAAGKEKDTLFVWNFDNDAISIPANIITQSDAKNLLARLIHIFISGHEKIIPFDPAVGFNIVYYGENQEKSFRQLKALGETAFGKEYYDDYYKAEIDKGYFDDFEETAYQDKLNTMEEVSEIVWLPLFEKVKALK